MPCTRIQEIDLADFAADPRAPAWNDFRDHYPRCAECSREVARFAVLGAALAAEGSDASAHPSEATLLAFATSRLVSDQRVPIEAHLAGCAPCRTELAVVHGFDFAAVAAVPKRPKWFDWLGEALALPVRRPALIAASVVVLAIPVAILVWQRAHETRAISSPPIAEAERGAPDVDVAMTQPEAPPTAEENREARAVAETPPPPALPEPAPIAKQPRQPLVAKQPPTQQPPEASPEPPPPIEIAALLPTESPLYSPGALARGSSVRIGAAARGLTAGAPAPEALGPAHVGASTRESPNLYWFLPEATSSSVEVTVVDPDADAPVLETTVPGPVAAGVHRVSLSEQGVRLKPGADYRWYVALLRDPKRRSQDVVSGAAIRYSPPAPDLSTRLSSAPPARAAHLYAESGLWYDAFDQLSSWLANEPRSARLHDHRAALLEQVGLADAAAFERGAPAER